MADLDSRQQAAVDAGPVDLFISAGAGSGKTRVLVTRFVHAVLGVPPYTAQEPGALLTVTYTEKAAGELAERIRAAFIREGRPDAARRAGEGWISTIHGMCARILRQHAFDAGLDPRFAVLDEVDASVLEVQAFEEAVTPLVASSRDVAVLVDSYGLDTVLSGARSIRADARALGLTASDVRVAPEQETTEQLLSLAASFTVLAQGLDGLRDLATVRKNAAAARGAAAAITTAAPDAGRSDARALLAHLSALSMSHCRSVEGHEVLVEEGRRLLEKARACAAQRAAEPLEAAMLAVLRAFEARYDAMKRERGALDFEDLQNATARLLETRADIAAQYRSRFAMIMIDEFQDTNELQLSIADRVSRGNLCTVGDGNQSIYAFRHADVEVFRRREQAVGQRAVLDTNYRTDPPLLRTLNGLFSAPAFFGASHAAQRPPATHREDEADTDDAVGRHPGADEGGRDSLNDDPAAASECTVLLVDWSAPAGRDRADVEAAAIAARCEELIAGGFTPGQIAVLMAAMRGGRAEAVGRALRARGIPAFLSTGGKFFECDEVAEVRAFLRVLDNLRDDEALATVLGGRLTGLSDDALFEIGSLARTPAARGAARRQTGRLWSVLEEVLPLVGPADEATLARAIEVITWARRQRGSRPLGELVLESLLRLDADLVLLASGPSGAGAWANVQKLVRMAEEFERVSGADLRGFIEYLALREVHATSEQEAVLQGEVDAVRVMSIHAAKGLEFPAVVVGSISRSGTDSPAISWGKVSGVPLLAVRLPTDRGTVPTTASLAVRTVRERVYREEAKRLLYVACTRAETSLTLVGLTDPEAGADDSLAGLVRRALGMGAGGTVRAGAHRIGDGRLTVRVAGESPTVEVLAAPPLECDASVVRLASDSQPEDRRVGAPGRLSYSGLALYEECPYRFYLTHIARLEPPPAVSDAGGALAFGRAVHAVLERTNSGSGPPDGVLEATASACGLATDELPRLRRAVDAFLTSATAGEVFGADRVLHEVPMAVPVRGVVLGGAMDLLAWQGPHALVVDYKTGTGAPSASQAEERYRLQGSCYALAVLAAGAASVRVVFTELETGRVTEYGYTPDDRRALEETIGSLIDRMAAGEYAPRRAYDPACCGRCPGFRGLCPVRPKRTGGAV